MEAVGTPALRTCSTVLAGLETVARAVREAAVGPVGVAGRVASVVSSRSRRLRKIHPRSRKDLESRCPAGAVALEVLAVTRAPAEVADWWVQSNSLFVSEAAATTDRRVRKVNPARPARPAQRVSLVIL